MEGLSKNQRKKQLRLQLKAQARVERKAAEKVAKVETRAVRKSEKAAMLAAMSEQERAAWLERIQATRKAKAEEREGKRARLAAALRSGARVAIDLDFGDLMQPGELRSLCQQLSYGYSSAARRAEAGIGTPLHLHLLGAGPGAVAQMERQITGLVHWRATRSDLKFDEFFKDCLADVVYLTADSPHEVDELDPSKVYVIGGIVDRNRHKGLCYARAQAAGVATARLPIAKHVKLAASAVITVNQVVEILAAYFAGSGWKEALQAALPVRKRNEAGQASQQHSPAPEVPQVQAQQQQGQQQQQQQGEEQQQEPDEGVHAQQEREEQQRQGQEQRRRQAQQQEQQLHEPGGMRVVEGEEPVGQRAAGAGEEAGPLQQAQQASTALVAGSSGNGVDLPCALTTGDGVQQHQQPPETPGTVEVQGTGVLDEVAEEQPKAKRARVEA